MARKSRPVEVFFNIPMTDFHGKMLYWLVVSTPLKNVGQIGNLFR